MMKKRKSRENAVAKRKREVEEMRANKVVVMEAAALVAAEAEDQQWIMRAVAVADEQMSWGTQWFPFWDVELMAESYFSALYSDVWDGYDDIWGFRASDQIPSPALRSPSN